MEKTAYDYYLESTDKENFIVEKTIEWKLPEGDLVKILISQCKEIRKLNYPPIEDYIDGVVKNNQEQIDTYINECLSIKQQYPKP
jgi:hypothetical protein